MSVWMSTGYRGDMRWRFLLRPGWLALTAVVICFAVAAFTLLAPWQFRRAAQRADTNNAIERSFSIPPQPLRSVLAAHSAPTQNTEWRQVQATGYYVPDAEMVDRGYLRPSEGVRIPDYPAVPGGEVTVTGRLRADELDPQNGEVVHQDGHRQVYAASSRTVSAATGVRLEPGYLQLLDGAPGVLSALPLPQLDAGPSFPYALEWLAFGTMAPLGLAYFAWREGTEGRREDKWSRDEDDPHDPPVAALADRYGR
jgi:cytochrome oxidase assembly protein ShyY1